MIELIDDILKAFNIKWEDVTYVNIYYQERVKTDNKEDNKVKHKANKITREEIWRASSLYEIRDSIISTIDPEMENSFNNGDMRIVIRTPQNISKNKKSFTKKKEVYINTDIGNDVLDANEDNKKCTMTSYKINNFRVYYALLVEDWKNNINGGDIE